MAREENSHALLSSYTKQLRNVAKKDTFAAETLDGAQEILLMLTVVLTIYFTFERLDIPIEYSIILIILYLRAMKLFGKSYKQYQSYVGNISAFEKLTKTMNNAISHREQREGTLKHKLQGNIKFSNVCFSHDHKPILENASFTFYHNRFNSIIGPSGKGKTTLVDLLCGLYLPDSGEILIDDVPLNKIDITFWRKQIGYVTQENNLLNTTIKENITLGDTNFSLEQIESALKKAHCNEFVSELPDGIMSGVGENGAQLSGGQRQRILIARALVHSPRLLILDEATSALDIETEKSLSAIFKDLSRTITVVSISHRPALIEISDNIINLNDKDLDEKMKFI
jgi:ATP-binding cassette subfamily C protein